MPRGVVCCWQWAGCVQPCVLGHQCRSRVGQQVSWHEQAASIMTASSVHAWCYAGLNNITNKVLACVGVRDNPLKVGGTAVQCAVVAGLTRGT